MVDSTISCVRLRDLAGLGRFRFIQAGKAVLDKLSASRRRPGADAASIAAGPAPRPRATSSRPETDDLVESTIGRGPS